MPDRRRHRGPHPSDAELFAPDNHAALRSAVSDLSWLLSRGYADPSALKLVGDRYQLRQRQRMAVLRSSCSDAQRDGRRAREVGPQTLRGQTIRIDGYNVLITLEAALAGGVLLLGRDGCLRDLASLHGHFKRVHETEPALRTLGAALAGWSVAGAVIYLDSPVSNSGRLAELMRNVASANGWQWTVELVPSADRVLMSGADGITATADSNVIDGCEQWANLARLIVEDRISQATWIDLGSGGDAGGDPDAP